MVPPPKTAAPGASIAKSAAPAPAQQRPASLPQQRAAAAAAAPAIKTIDKALIHAAWIAALIGAGFNFYVFFFVLKPLIETFQP
jgi:hypothetical protein